MILRIRSQLSERLHPTHKPINETARVIDEVPFSILWVGVHAARRLTGVPKALLTLASVPRAQHQGECSHGSRLSGAAGSWVWSSLHGVVDVWGGEGKCRAQDRAHWSN